MHWTPLSGAAFETVFGPDCRNSRVRRRRQAKKSQRQRKRNLAVELLEEKAVPAMTAAIAATSLDTTAGTNATIGEVVRYRVTAEIPFDPSGYGGIDLQAALPPGLEFLNDNTATIALVSNGAGIMSSISDPAAYVTGNETTVGTITPSAKLPPGSVSVVPNGGLGSLVTFASGVSHVADADADLEYVVIEFNALVNNAGTSAADSNDAGDVVSTGFQMFIGGTQCDCFAEQTVTVTEPSITDMVKTVSNATPSMGDTVTFSISFSNAAGAATAYDVAVRDSIPAGLAFNPTSVNVTGGTGVSVGADANVLRRQHRGIRAGASVTITYTATVNAAAGVTLANNASLDYTSVPGPSGTSPNATGSVTSGGAGSTLGERNGSGGINDYVDAASQSLKVFGGGGGTNSLSGLVFGDTDHSGNFTAGDEGLSGVPIALINEANGQTVATTTTALDGTYSFTDIADGTYSVVETQQPAGHDDGLDFAGSAGGVADPVPGDIIRNVTLTGGVNATDYLFGECACVEEGKAELSGS